jgi:amidophosphoribosyltransferase
MLFIINTSKSIWKYKLKEECGIFGVYHLPENTASQMTYYGLFALQHRGQESAGIAVNNGDDILWYKGQGLVNEVFDKRMLAYLDGDSGIGHVRYSTSGDSNLENAQPLIMNYRDGKIALVHNGNLINADEKKQELEKKGAFFQTDSDSEVILALIARFSLQTESLEEAITRVMKEIRGGYSIILLTKEKMVGFRDPHGLRPLCLGQKDGSYIFASESTAFKTIGGEYVRDVNPGEIVTVENGGIKSCRAIKSEGHFCSFEYIYFSRPDSYIGGLSVYSARVAMGRQLFHEHPVDADIVISIPDSGTPAAIGYAYASGIPFEQGLFRSPYVGRTFIKPSQDLREAGVNAKLSPLVENIRGKRIVMVDDSIVRGTTIKRIIQMMRKAGALEIHVMISSPPVAHSCYYGIDTPDPEKLIAANYTVAEITKIIEADSLHYLSSEGLDVALANVETGLCKACFDGKYPVELEGMKYEIQRCGG